MTKKTPKGKTQEPSRAAAPPAAPAAALERIEYPIQARHGDRPRLEWTREQLDIIKDQHMRNFSDAEFGACMAVARAKGLDPLRRQIYFRKQNEYDAASGGYVEKVINIVGIDGFRAIADRSGVYDGQDEPTYEYRTEEINGRTVEHLHAARVKVYRKDITRPFVGLALLTEFGQTKKDGTPNAMWSKMPHNQLAKTAEALAMRKAFPDDCGDLYAPEECGEEGAKGGERFGAAPATRTGEGPPAESVVTKWGREIDAATTAEDFRRIAGGLADAKMNRAEREELGKLYNARHEEARRAALPAPQGGQT